MAAKWIQYSVGVASFAGVTITGVLWYGRTGREVRGEDVAECAAATWERATVPFLFGDESPSFSTTTMVYDVDGTAATATVSYAGDVYMVDSYIRRGDAAGSTRGVQLLAALLRDSALFNYKSVSVRWLDPGYAAPAHGDVLAGGVPYWYAESRPGEPQVDYYYLAASNYTDGTSGLATVTPSVGNWYWSTNSTYVELPYLLPYPAPETSSNSFPLCGMFLWSGGAGAAGGDWWSRNGLGTNVWRFSHESVEPIPGYADTFVVKRSPFVGTNILGEIKTLAGGMTRTVCWIPNFFGVDYTNCRTYEVSLATETVVSESGSGNAYPDYSAAARSAVKSGMVLGEYTDSGPDAGIWMPSVFLYGAWTAYATGDKGPDPEDEWIWYWSSSWSSKSTVLDVNEYFGCTLPYPSMFAITNGYVSSISIYAVAKPERLGGYAYPSLEHADATVTYSGTFPNAEDYNDIGFGYVDYVCGFPALEQSASKTKAAWIKGDGFPLVQARVNLIGTWNNPSERPVFDFGSDIVLSDPPFSEESVKIDGDVITYPDGSESEYNEEKFEIYGSLDLELAGFIVVVDWNWKHLNPSAPFVPTTHTPGWAMP